MTDYIKESGMYFISDNSFHIEKSPLYTNIGKGVKSVEFIRIKDTKLVFVEAKTTFPNPQNSSLSGNLVKYNEEIADIRNKLIHSLNLYSSVKAGVAEEKLPDAFNAQDKIQIVFVLVIKKHKIGWCKPIKTKLLQELPSYLKKIWKPEVYVINSDGAVKWQLAAASQDKSP
jgi:hypothetical protein